ncbi:hypothetical protein NL321_30015, partial [Klebsiella pneumoniae]|nr:hypothetical protein [Klebsiella pneumoniae]
LENVAPVQFLPGEGFSSIPEVTIARPDAGQSFQGVLNGRAIITDAETFVTRADVYVDGVFRAIAIRQGGRPPECAAV